MKKSPSTRLRNCSRTPRASGAGAGTREKLLQSAELLFSTKGFSEVTVREIAAHAGVNFALVAYYFRGKQALFDEVFRLHADPLLQEGMNRLAEITRNGRKPSLEEILKAWLLPWLQLDNTRESRAIHLRVTANLSHERWEYTREVSGDMRRNHLEFIEALHACLPHLAKETLMWRLHFIMGSLVFGIRQPAPLTALSDGRCDPNDLEKTFEQILPFAVAGFLAPESSPGVEKQEARSRNQE